MLVLDLQAKRSEAIGIGRIPAQEPMNTADTYPVFVLVLGTIGS